MPGFTPAYRTYALGLLPGPAFALFYTFAGIPIARSADVGVRRSIIALALFIWSGMTALTAFAGSLSQLALARVGVGVGEAGCSPPAHSYISDLFPLERRATALAIYSLGIPIGASLDSLVGASLHAFYGYGAASFIPVFLMRVHGFELGPLGTWLAAIGLTTGVLGTYLGGAVSDRLARAEVRWYMRALASAIPLFIINLIGLGLGPWFVGMLSDALKPSYGVDAIRYALLGTVVVGAAWSSVHYLLASRSLEADLRAKDA